MSGSTAPPGNVRLRVRYDVLASARRPLFTVGTTVAVYIDAVDRLTKQIAPITDAALSFVYRLPELGGYPEQNVPVIPYLLAPGQWRADVPTVMTGPYRHWAALLGAGWLMQTEVGQFDVTGGL
jgi:hypothetical protein